MTVITQVAKNLNPLHIDFGAKDVVVGFVGTGNRNSHFWLHADIRMRIDSHKQQNTTGKLL